MKNIFLSLGILLFCTYSYAQQKITVSEAYKNLKANNKIQLLDVRTSEEYNSKHIAKSVLVDWTKKAEFEKNINSTLDKKKPVYVYCLSGGRSMQAAKLLEEKGYNVKEIDGGMLKWEAAKLPIETKSADIEGLNLKKFKELVKSDNLVLVDFHAVWCGPCKELDPILQNIAKKYTQKVKLIKIDVDQNKTLTQQLGISSIPLIHLYKDGKLIWKHNGLTDQQTIEKQLK